MIFDTLCDYAIKALDENNLVLTHYEIGQSFTFVTLTHNNQNFTGVTLTPKDEGSIILPHYFDAKEIVRNCGYDLAKRACALACINAIGQYLGHKEFILQANLRQSLSQLILDSSDSKSHIVFVGHLKPVVQKIKENRNYVEVFCRDTNDASQKVYSDIFEYEALAKCDIAIITGSSLIGSTIDAMFKFCGAKIVILAGFSASGYHTWFKNTPITHIASIDTTMIDMQRCEQNKENIFKQKAFIQELQ